MTPLLTGVFASQISGHLTPPFTLTGNYDALATVTVPSGGLSSITFAGIPQTGYSHLQIRQLARTNLTSAIQTGNALQFNLDTATNYAVHRLSGSGSGSALAEAYPNVSDLYYSSNTGNDAAANIFGVAVIDILDYTNTNKFTTVRVLTGADANGSGRIGLQSGLWRSIDAINRITINCRDGGSFLQHSQFALYGVK